MRVRTTQLVSPHVRLGRWITHEPAIRPPVRDGCLRGSQEAGHPHRWLPLDPARPPSAAIAVGVTVGFAQMVPLMLLPVVFQFPLGYGPLLGILAIAPFAIALFVAAPVSGILLRRYGPRGMMTFGTFFMGWGTSSWRSS